MAVKNLKMKAARAGMDLSQEELAELVGVTRQTIGMIEAGKYNPTLNLCLAICKALHKTLDELFWRNSRRYGSQRNRKENSDMMDERTTQVRNKIMSEMAMLMYLFVAAAFAVKVLLLGKGIRDCVVEYVILILAPLYQYVRARQLKFSLYRPGYGSQKHRVRRNLVSVTVGALVFILVFWRTSKTGTLDVKEVVPGVLTFVVVFLLTRVVIVRIEKKRADRLEQEYEDDGEE